MDDEALDMLLARNTPVVPALQFEQASIERGPEFGMPQRVIDGHKETLEGGAESARTHPQGRRPARHGRRLRLRLEPARRLRQGADVLRQVRRLHARWRRSRCATQDRRRDHGPRATSSARSKPGKLADVLVVDGDVLADIALLEDRARFLAVMQGGVVKAGQLAGTAPANPRMATA